MTIFKKKLKIEIENAHDIIPGDVFYLNYYGINVFFTVSKFGSEKVAVYEIAKKKIKYNNKTVEVICAGKKPSKSPVIFEEYFNTHIKENIWVESRQENGKTMILVPIRYASRIYSLAVSNGEPYPVTGLFKAYRLDQELKEGILNFYWEIGEKKSKKKEKIRNWC